MVVSAFSPARAWRPAVGTRLARTLAVTGSGLHSYCDLFAPACHLIWCTHTRLSCSGVRVDSDDWLGGMIEAVSRHD